MANRPALQEALAAIRPGEAGGGYVWELRVDGEIAARTSFRVRAALAAGQGRGVYPNAVQRASNSPCWRGPASNRMLKSPSRTM